MKQDTLNEAGFACFKIWVDPVKTEDQKRKSWESLGTAGQDIWIKSAEAAIKIWKLYE